MLEKFKEEVSKEIEEAAEHLNLTEIYPVLEMERCIKTWEIQLSSGGYNSTNAKCDITQSKVNVLQRSTKKNLYILQSTEHVFEPRNGKPKVQIFIELHAQHYTAIIP